MMMMRHSLCAKPYVLATICSNRVTMRDAGNMMIRNLNNHASVRKEGGPCFVKVVMKKC